MAKKDKKDKKNNSVSSGEIARNKKALFNYEVIEKFEAGIVLLGTEVKSLRDRGVNMSDSYASFKKGELFIVNMHISPYHFGNRNNHEPLRERKLLMKKREFVVIDLEEKKKTSLNEKSEKIQNCLMNFLINSLLVMAICGLLVLFAICGILAVRIIWKMILILF